MFPGVSNFVGRCARGGGGGGGESELGFKSERKITYLS